MYETTQRGFELMNDALKARVERESPPEPALKQRVKLSVKANDMSEG